jgi:hypothetical protein
LTQFGKKYGYPARENGGGPELETTVCAAGNGPGNLNRQLHLFGFNGIKFAELINVDCDNMFFGIDMPKWRNSSKKVFARCLQI